MPGSSGSSTGGGAGGSHQTRNSPLVEGDKCLVYFKEKLYEAKVLRVDDSNLTEGRKYLIHYQNWATRYDCWKNSSQVFRSNEEHKKRQSEIEKSLKESEEGGSIALHSRSATKKSSRDLTKKNQTSSARRSASRNIEQESNEKTAAAAAAHESSAEECSNSRPDTPDSLRSEISSTSSKTAHGISANTESKSKTSSPAPGRANSRAASKESVNEEPKKLKETTGKLDESGGGAAASKKRPRKDSAVDSTDSLLSPEAKKASNSTTNDHHTPSTLSRKKSSTEKSPPRSSGGGGGNKSSSSSTNEHTKLMSSQVELPESLKSVVVDDYDYIVRQKMLVDIESAPSAGCGGGPLTVSNIVDDYVASTSDDRNQHAAFGVKDLFNVVLGSNLLYKFERPQYDEILKDDKKKGTLMCDIYGAEHFLRLFVKINELMEEAKLSKDYIQFIAPYLRNIVQFLKDNSEKYFSAQSRYVPATPDYLRKSISDYDQ